MIMTRLMLTICLLGIIISGALLAVSVSLSAKTEPTEAAYTQAQVNALSRFCRDNGYRVTYRTARDLTGSRVVYVRCEAGTN